MPDLSRVEIFNRGGVIVALAIEGPDNGWLVLKSGASDWQRVGKATEKERVKALAPVELQGSITFRYSARPEYYGTNDPQKMAELDLGQTEGADLISGVFGGMAAKNATLKIEPKEG